jgi:hypothetical protein
MIFFSGWFASYFWRRLASWASFKWLLACRPLVREMIFSAISKDAAINEKVKVEISLSHPFRPQRFVFAPDTFDVHSILVDDVEQLAGSVSAALFSAERGGNRVLVASGKKIVVEASNEIENNLKFFASVSGPQQGPPWTFWQKLKRFLTPLPDYDDDIVDNEEDDDDFDDGLSNP